MKDAVATMGAILPDDAGGRDAVHVAVIPVVAGQILKPCDHVGFKTSTVEIAGEQEAFADGAPLGIVDPFIKGYVEKGQRFWLYLYPRTITSLRHQWTHPAFPDAKVSETYAPPASKLASEQWLRAFIKMSDCPDYDTVMKAVTTGKPPEEDDGNYYVDKEYLHFGGRDAHGEIPPEFWDHVEIVTGQKMKVRPTYFSCSC